MFSNSKSTAVAQYTDQSLNGAKVSGDNTTLSASVFFQAPKFSETPAQTITKAVTLVVLTGIVVWAYRRS